MDRLIFTSHSAIAESAIARQGLVNELANVSTAGFKRSFDMAMRTIKVEGEGFDSRYQTQVIARDVIDLEPGPIISTNRPLGDNPLKMRPFSPRMLRYSLFTSKR